MMSLKHSLALIPLLLATSGSAWGAVKVVHSIPENGAVVAHAPRKMVLTFDGNIDPSKTELSFSNLSGESAPPLPRQPKATGPTKQLVVVMPAFKRRGAYVLHYRVVGTDGERTNGMLSFTSGGY